MAESGASQAVISESPGPTKAWVTIVSAMLLCAIIGGALTVGFSVLADSWMKTFGAKHSEVMGVGVAVTICGGFFGIVAGKLAARFPSRPIIGVGALLAAIAFFLSSLTNSVWEILLLFAVVGGPAVALTGPVLGQFLAIRLFEKPGLALGVVSLGMKVGAASIPLATAILLTQVDWRTGMMIMAGVILTLSIPLILFGITEPKNPARAHSAKSAAINSGSAGGQSLSTWGILRDPVFIGIVLVVLPSVCLSAAIYFNFTLYLIELGGTPALAGTMLAVGSITGIIACPIFGMLTDRIDHRLFIAALIGLNLAAVVVCATLTHINTMWVVMPLLTLGGAIIQPLFPAMLLRRFGPVDFPRAVGVAQPALYSATLGALFSAFARDRMETYQGAFAVTLLLMVPVVIGFVVLVLALRRPSLTFAEASA